MDSINRSAARLVPVIRPPGLALCIVPGLIAMAALSVNVPVCVVERLGPVQSLKRGAILTSQHRWPILVVSVVRWIVWIGGSSIIQAALPAEDAWPAKLVNSAWDVLLF